MATIPFAVQDEITEHVAAAVAPQTLDAEVARATNKQPMELSDWKRVIRALWHLDKATKADGDAAHALLSEAVERAPHLAQAHCTHALYNVYEMLHGWTRDPASALEAAGRAAQRAVSLDGNDAGGLAILGLVAGLAWRYEESLGYLNRAVGLNPNLANGYGFMATTYGPMGDFGAACAAIERALRLSPHDPTRFLWFAGKGIIAYIARHYEEVVEITQSVLRENPNFASANRQLAASLATRGRDEEAQSAMSLALALMPDVTIAKVCKMIPVKDPDARERWLTGLRKAGMPE